MKLVTAADPHYLFSYGPALIASCLEHGVSLHIEVVEPTDTCLSFIAKLEPLIRHGITFSVNTPAPGEYARLGTYCACRRFAVAADLLERGMVDRVLVIDIDSYVRCPIPDAFSIYDLGLWLRPNEPEPGMQCLAGCSMFTPASAAMARDIYRTCEASGFSLYFADQWSIWKVFQESPWARVPEMAGHFIDFAKWSGPLIDWDFRDGSYIWTGKGLRKKENMTYVAEQNRLTATFFSLLALTEKERASILNTAEAGGWYDEKTVLSVQTDQTAGRVQQIG